MTESLMSACEMTTQIILIFWHCDNHENEAHLPHKFINIIQNLIVISLRGLYCKRIKAFAKCINVFFTFTFNKFKIK